MLEVRAVPAGQDDALHRAADARLDPIDLSERPVGIVRALDQLYGRRDAFGLALDRPGTECRIEPDITPPLNVASGSSW
jgi:hypothetical protein